MQPVRILLDSASQSNYITARCRQRLQLATEKAHISILGIGQSLSIADYKCAVDLQATHSHFQLSASCLLIIEIARHLPQIQVNSRKLAIPSNIRLADPDFNKPSEIDILLESSVFWSLICIGQISLGSSLPCLQKRVSVG